MIDPKKEFYEQKIVPFYQAKAKGIGDNLEKAEKFFAELMKLLITLSTGMIAFIGVAQKESFISASHCQLIVLFGEYIGSILFAVFAYLSMALHYKDYADNAQRGLKKLYQQCKQSEYENIKKDMGSEEANFLTSNDCGWQGITIWLGIFALAFFIASTFGVIRLFFQ